jgi:hypothetical protein
MLVEALSTEWGTRPSAAGKTVWFTIVPKQAPAPKPEATAP